MAISTSSIVSENILAIFNALHAKGQRASFAFGTDTKPYSGKQCLVYVVTFSDNTTWAMRIPVHSVHAGADTISNSVEHEVTILQTLQLRGFVWSPSLIGYDSTFDNQIQFPYIISSWVPGTQLRWNDNSPALREDRNKIIHQIAHMTIDLAKASHAQGSTNSLGFLIDAVDRKINRVLKDQAPSMTLRSCFSQRALVSEVFNSQEEQTTTLISHEDLDPSNIIVDNNFNVKGIIDWGSARVLPAQLAIALPRFLAIEMWDPRALSVESPESRRIFLQPTTTLSRDRECLIRSLSSFACEDHIDHKLYPQCLVRQIYSTLSDPNVDWIRLLFESVFSRGTHIWMTERSWLEEGITSSSADWSNAFELPSEERLLRQVDLFLRKAEAHGHISSETLFKVQQMSEKT